MGSVLWIGGSFGMAAATMDQPATTGGLSQLATTREQPDTDLHKGLIGFDVETGSRIVRPELLRLAKRGTQRTADGEFALAA